jgi:hypothetical protein
MMTYGEVKQVLGPVDDAVVAEIVRTGADRAELSEALAWINSDEALVNEHRAPPTGAVAALVEILTSDDDDEPEAGIPGPEPT